MDWLTNLSIKNHIKDVEDVKYSPNQLAINKINQQLKNNFKFIKYDGIILNTFSEKLLKQNNMDVIKTIVYLDGLSKKEIIDSFESIVKELETCNEIEEVYKNIITKKQKDSNIVQENYDKLLEKTNKLNLDEETLINKLHILEEQVAMNTKLFEEQQQIKQEAFDKKQEAFDKKQEVFDKDILKKQEDIELLTNTIDGVFRTEIYEDEFNIPESQFVEKGRLIQLKPDIYSVDNGLLFSNHKDNYFKELIKYENNINKKLLFNYDKLLPENEYVILIRIKAHHAYILNYPIKNGGSIITYYINEFNVIYITNFGRIIKINPTLNLHCPTDYCGHPGYLQYMPMTNIIYKQNKLYNQSGYHPYKENLILDYELQPLPYRMPKLFLTVIEAFQQQNTDMMQECCKKYLDITRESERKTEILTALQFNKILNEKNTIIANKDAEITEHLTIIDLQSTELDKLKVEIAKLKTALQSTLNL